MDAPLREEQPSTTALVLDAVADAILVLDRDDRIVRSNRSAQRLFGYAASELLGQHVSLVIPDSVEATTYRFVHAYRARKETGNNGYRLVARSAQGSKIPIDLVLMEVPIEEDALFVATIHESSARNREERELLRYIEDLESARLHSETQSERVLELAEELSSEKKKLRAHEDQLEANERELTRYIRDLEMTRLQFEKQAEEMARLAEELHGEKERLEESRRLIEHQAYHDALTRLGNRALMSKILPTMISDAKARGTKVGLIYLDLDNFKEVNDRLGHEAGDAHLRAVADALRGCIRSDDQAIRQGGDEFAVAVRLDTNRDENDLREMAERIQQTLRLTVEGPGFTIETGASVGIALCPDDGKDMDGLLMAADAAMYRAKRAAKVGAA